jgi:hypothetical protein
MPMSTSNIVGSGHAHPGAWLDSEAAFYESVSEAAWAADDPYPHLRQVFRSPLRFQEEENHPVEGEISCRPNRAR